MNKAKFAYGTAIWISICCGLLLLAQTAAAQITELETLNREVVSQYQKGEHDRAIVTALKILNLAEKNFGPEHPDVAMALDNLAFLYRNQGQHAAAEPLSLRAQAIWDKVYDSGHPVAAVSLTDLAALHKPASEGKAAQEPAMSPDGTKKRVTKAEVAQEKSFQSPKPEFAVVRVFFATDRNLTASKKVSEMFGGSRSSLRYGVSDVSIPRDHRLGELEAPSVWKMEFREDPAKHVVLLNVFLQPKEKYFSDVAARVRASKNSSAFIFVHGYNVTFDDAARRTAQISYDLAFDGAPVFYSWPSQGTTPGYTVDEQNVEWAQANLKGFLEDFFNRSNAQNIYLVAHSMGNRALTRAVASLMNEKPALRKRLKEVILTAPDIDADVFNRDIAPALTKMGRPITLYASSEDLALVASKNVHGSPRAGDSGQGLVVVPGIETIDATGTDTSLLGHSYFAETSSVLSDIFNLVRNGQRAEKRANLRSVDTQTGKYWMFKK